jgi:hypothetical protein
MKKKFNPDKFLSEYESFNPDKFLKETNETEIELPEDESQNSRFGEMSEENPLIKGAYAIGEALTPADKPRSAILGPVIQALTLGSPIETIKKEYTSIEPDVGSSFMGRAREIVQTPLMDPYQKDVAEGEKIKAAAKMWLEQKFPKAYKVASEMLPSDAAMMPLDILSSQKIPSIPVGKLTSKISGKLEDMAALNREKALINEVNLTGSKAAKDIDKLKTQKITNTIQRYGLDDKLSNPVELKNAISGETRLGFDALGNEVQKKISPGILDQLGDELRAGSEFLTEKLGKVDIKEIADKAANKLIEKFSNTSSGVKFNSVDAEKLKQEIYDILKVGQGENYRPFDSLIDSKRSSAKYYFDLKNDSATPTVAGPSLTNTHKAIWDEIDNFINEKALNDPDLKGFANQNSDISDLLSAEEMLVGSRQRQLMAPGMVDIAAGAGLGYGLGNLLGKPEYGAFIGGGIGAMRGAATGVRETIPGRLAGLQQSLANKVSPVTNIPVAGAIPAVSTGLSRDQGRTPQSVVPPDMLQAHFLSKGLIENLADYEIPRSANEILDNKRLVLAKVAQATNDPNTVNMLEDALNKHPNKLSKLLPLLIANPATSGLFRINKYASWVDGKILDPMEVQKAYKEVNDRQISNTEKIMLQDGLNKDGSFPESF